MSRDTVRKGGPMIATVAIELYKYLLLIGPYRMVSEAALSIERTAGNLVL